MKKIILPVACVGMIAFNFIGLHDLYTQVQSLKSYNIIYVNNEEEIDEYYKDEEEKENDAKVKKHKR